MGDFRPRRVLLLFGLGQLLAISAASTRPPPPPPPVALSRRKSLASGCASGLSSLCVRTLLQPFDTVKTLQQASSGPLRPGVVATARELVRHNGVGALYRGLGPSLVGSVPAMALYMGACRCLRPARSPLCAALTLRSFARAAMYKSSKASLAARFPSVPSLLVVALSAAVGNTLASLLRVPMELVKQRTQAGIYPGGIAAVRAISAEGLRGFFVPGAIASQLMRDIPFGVFMLLSCAGGHTLHSSPDLEHRLPQMAGARPTLPDTAVLRWQVRGPPRRAASARRGLALRLAPLRPLRRRRGRRRHAGNQPDGRGQDAHADRRLRFRIRARGADRPRPVHTCGGGGASARTLTSRRRRNGLMTAPALLFFAGLGEVGEVDSPNMWWRALCTAGCCLLPRSRAAARAQDPVGWALLARVRPLRASTRRGVSRSRWIFRLTIRMVLAVHLASR